MSLPHAQTQGREGELLAAALLESQGYVLIDKNYRVRGGEIDIIAREGGDLVFVEVRFFQEGSAVHPIDSISPLKQKRCLTAAKHYCMRHQLEDNIRFDVVSIERRSHRAPAVTLLKDCWPSL